MRLPRPLIASVLLIGLTVAAAACGSSDSDGSSASDTTAKERTTTTADAPAATGDLKLTGSFCDKARQMTGIVEDMFNASTDDQDDAAALAESKRFFATITASLQSLDESAPPEIAEDIAYLKDLFQKANAKAQAAKTMDAYSQVASDTFGMDSTEYDEHNDAVDSYFEDTCGIGASSSSTTTTGG